MAPFSIVLFIMVCMNALSAAGSIYLKSHDYKPIQILVKENKK